MDKEVEEFFYKIKFPFTIGYGMTECGPLISYAPWDEFVLGSSGKILDIMEARIYKETPEAETGEIQVRGENVTWVPTAVAVRKSNAQPYAWAREGKTALYPLF